jgi:hypothetical protein
MIRLFVFLLVSAANLLAQSGNSSVTGTVYDPSGSTAPGATVVLKNKATALEREATSDEEGRFQFREVPPGVYSISATLTGFQPATVDSFEVNVNTPSTATLRFRDLVGTAESVSVTASVAAINTADSSIGNAFSSRPILQLPLSARNPAGLLSLQPGVTFTGEDPSDPRFRDIRNGAVSGARTDQANVTLDGVDVNDQVERSSFTSVLRVTLDSVQEFRVTTFGATAEQGRGSGAQIALVTKSGSNNLHGSLYHFHRNTLTSANDFFNNRSGVSRPKLIRNVFGASLGGPIKRNRTFLFGNYEGRRDASEGSALRRVPLPSLREGNIRYFANNGELRTLTPQDLRRLDPLGIGPNSAILDLLRTYPESNDNTTGDGINSAGFRFNAATPLRWNTYILRLDHLADTAGRHAFFARGNLQNDRVLGVPQFPGQPAAQATLENSKGLAIGYNGTWSPTLTGAFRYGFTRQAIETTGVQTTSLAWPFGFNSDSPVPTTRGAASIVPVHTISADLSYSRRAHLFQWGATGRLFGNDRTSYQSSFHSAESGESWFANGNEVFGLLPDVRANQRRDFVDSFLGLLGVLNRGRASWNYDVSGAVLPVGAPVARRFAGRELELYAQDTWRPASTLTIILGLRWTYMPPVFERDGTQVSVEPDLSTWFETRGALAAAGRSQMEAGRISFVPVDSPSGRPLYPAAKGNFAPRISLAWAPNATSGLTRVVFGGEGRGSLRLGAGMYYDLFGMGILRQMDANTPGFTTTLVHPGGWSLATAPRFTSVTSVPSEIILPAPPGGPGTPPDIFGGGTGIDQKIRPPYTINYNLVWNRELPAGFTLEVGYIGRLSRRSLVNINYASATNLVDPKSGVSYWEAAQPLAAAALNRVPVSSVQPIPYWENLWANAATPSLTATQAIYQAFVSGAPDWGGTISNIDNLCRPACSVLGPSAMSSPQFWGLRTLGSHGFGTYQGLQLSLRKRFSQGVQFDFNYAWSKSIDLTSMPERGGGGQNAFGNFFIVNPWDRSRNRAVSDFDLTHQANINWVAELPFGRGKRWLGAISPLGNALLGGWQLSGITRLSTGFPLSVASQGWPVDWSTIGRAISNGVTPNQQTNKNAVWPNGQTGPAMFADPVVAFSQFREPLPGETGDRNQLRGDGLFNMDLGLGKRFAMPVEGHSLQFRAEAFNVTNSVSFLASFAGRLGQINTFGRYSQTAVPARVMQFGLRYEF